MSAYSLPENLKKKEETKQNWENKRPEEKKTERKSEATKTMGIAFWSERDR